MTAPVPIPMAPRAPVVPHIANESLRLGDVVRVVVKHAFWLLLLTVAVPVVVGFWTARLPKVYEAATTIVFDVGAPNTLGNKVDTFDPYSMYLNQQEMMETEFKVITSMHTAQAVAAAASLDTDRAFLAAVFPGTPPERVTDAMLAGYIQSRVKVEPVKGTHIATVSFEDNDPARAQRLVMAVVETYKQMSAEESGGATKAAFEFLTAQLGNLKRDLETSEDKLHEFKEDRNLISVSLNDQSNMLREEINALNQAVTAAQIKHSQLLARATALGKVTTKNPDDVPASEFLSNETLQNLRKNYELARADLGVQRGMGRLDNHPDVVALRNRLDDALRAFIAEVHNIQAAASRDASVAASETGSLSSLLSSAKTRALELNGQEIVYNRLYRTTAANEKLYQNVLERMKEVDLARTISARTVKVLDAAGLPSSPVRPRASLNIAVGTLVGFVLGLIVALLREFADRTVKTPREIETKLGLTSLGLLPESAQVAPGTPKRRRGSVLPGGDGGPELMVHRQPTSSMAEAARSIRSNIMFMSPDRPPRVMLVTSALPGEGKTTTATSIATTFAQAGSRVLLVDLDLRRPRIHRVFGVSSDRGVTTALLGEPLENVIQTTEVPNLSVLAAGPVPPNPAELLVSEKMNDIIARLSESYDRVIIDSPPANPITDAVVLSTRVDGVLLVVRAFQTTLDQVRHASRSIADVNGNLLGVILNAVDLGKMEYKYYYYHRYYNYSSEPSAPNPAGSLTRRRASSNPHRPRLRYRGRAA